MNLNLKKLDINKSLLHEHPDIVIGKEYLILYNGYFFAGGFYRQWFGLSFDNWYAPLQFDAPGSNSSRWEQIWEINKEI